MSAQQNASQIAPTQDEITQVIEPFAALEGPLLPMLHALQSAFGCVPEGAVAVLAERLNISRAETHGVISFYHDFKEVPAGRHVVKICRAEACQAMGASALAAQVLDELGTQWHGTTASGAITIEPVYCLGLCANGPAAIVDERPVAGLETHSFLAQLKAMDT